MNKPFQKFMLFNASCVALASCGGNAQEQKEKMNVLFFIVDDLRPELGCYGADYMHTPNIDSLAESGHRFTRSYCNIPVSGASRASLLSGTRPTKENFVNFYASASVDNPTATPISQWFRDQGYTTISNGKVFHNFNDWENTWDDLWAPTLKCGKWTDYLTEENLEILKNIKTANATPYEAADVAYNEYGDGKTADKTIADLERLAKTGEPFFLACGFVKPHLPFNSPSNYWEYYNEDSISLPDNYILPNKTIPQIAFAAQHHSSELRGYYGMPQKGLLKEETARKLIHGYRAGVTYTDDMVGKVMATLRKTGLDKNTVVVLIGDHGWLLGDHGIWCKHSNFETAMNTPMIIYSPEYKEDEKKQVDEIVEYVDLYPTICDLAGVDAPTHLEGASMRQLLDGNSEGWKNFAVSKYQNGTTVIVGDVFYTEWRNVKGKFLGEMLYDHSNDPDENNNLAKDPKHKELLNKMRKELVEKRGFDYPEQ